MPETRQPQFTDDQLHERACIVCGKPGHLVPAGHVKVDNGEGRQLVWAVAAHREHVGGES